METKLTLQQLIKLFKSVSVEGITLTEHPSGICWILAFTKHEFFALNPEDTLEDEEDIFKDIYYPLLLSKVFDSLHYTDPFLRLKPMYQGSWTFYPGLQLTRVKHDLVGIFSSAEAAREAAIIKYIKERL